MNYFNRLKTILFEFGSDGFSSSFMYECVTVCIFSQVLAVNIIFSSTKDYNIQKSRTPPEDSPLDGVLIMI